jgi:hypothetical protein
MECSAGIRMRREVSKEGKGNKQMFRKKIASFSQLPGFQSQEKKKKKFIGKPDKE